MDTEDIALVRQIMVAHCIQMVAKIRIIIMATVKQRIYIKNHRKFLLSYIKRVLDSPKNII